MKKRVLALTLVCSMAVSLAACGGSSSESTTTTAAAADTEETEAAGDTADTTSAGASSDYDYSSLEPQELILADAASNGAALNEFNLEFTDKVSEITGGQLTIDYHGLSELGGDADILRQAQSGDIAIIGSQIAPVVSFVPEMAIFDLPMVFAKYDGDQIENVLNGDSETRQAIDTAYETAGLHLLGFLQNATYRLTTANRELPDLASFKGLKIRTMENSNHMAFWSAIGAEPTPLAWPEVYISLQNGMIDAEENAADTIVGANLNEVQSVLACTNHILYCNQFAINKDIWDGLDPAYQAALEQAFDETLTDMREELQTIDSDSKQKLQDAGMTLQEYDESFYDEILALDGVQDLYTQIDSDVNGLATTLQNELAEQ